MFEHVGLYFFLATAELTSLQIKDRLLKMPKVKPCKEEHMDFKSLQIDSFRSYRIQTRINKTVKGKNEKLETSYAPQF